MLAVLRGSFHHEELLDVDDHMLHNWDAVDIHDWNDHAASTQNTTIPNDKKHDDQQEKEQENLDNESWDGVAYRKNIQWIFDQIEGQRLPHGKTCVETIGLEIVEIASYNLIAKHLAILG